MVVPGDTFEKRVDETHQQETCRKLRVEPGTLGDAARDNGRNRSGKGQQKEKSYQLVAVLLRQMLGPGEETHAGAEHQAQKNGYELVRFFFLLTFAGAVPAIV